MNNLEKETINFVRHPRWVAYYENEYGQTVVVGIFAELKAAEKYQNRFDRRQRWHRKSTRCVIINMPLHIAFDEYMQLHSKD